MPTRAVTFRGVAWSNVGNNRELDPAAGNAFTDPAPPATSHVPANKAITNLTMQSKCRDRDAPVKLLTTLQGLPDYLAFM